MSKFHFIILFFLFFAFNSFGQLNGKIKIDDYKGTDNDPNTTEFNLTWQCDVNNQKINFPLNYSRVTMTRGNKIAYIGSFLKVEINYNGNIKVFTDDRYVYLDIDENGSDNVKIEKVVLKEMYGWNGSYYNLKERDVFPNITIDLKPFKEQIKEKKLFDKTKNGNLNDCFNYFKNSTLLSNKSYVEIAMFNKANSISDYLLISTNLPTLKDKCEEKIYNLAMQGTSGDCDNYISNYPSGKFVSQVSTYKTERLLYEKCVQGATLDCDNYLKKYPSGKFVSDVNNLKAEKIAAAQRSAKIKQNSNKALWKLGNRVCYCDYKGIIVSSIDQWNEDKSMFKGKIVASPGGLYQGEILKKGNEIWIAPAGWHLCLQDEIDYALQNDKSLEAEDQLKNKKMKFPKGDKVCQTFSNTFIWTTHFKVVCTVQEWNEDFTKMKLKILNNGGASYDTNYKGQKMIEGTEIWDTPIGWEKCN